MKNRNMKQKITIAFGAVVICFFVTVGALFYGMVNISTRYTQFYKNNHEAIVHVDKVKIYTLATIQNLVEAMINDDPTATKTHLSNVDSYRAGLEENAGWFLEHYNGDMTLVNQFHTQLQATSEVTNKVIEYLSTGSDRAKEQARLTFINEFDPEVYCRDHNCYRCTDPYRYYGNDPDTFRSGAGKTAAGSYEKDETR